MNLFEESRRNWLKRQLGLKFIALNVLVFVFSFVLAHASFAQPGKNSNNSGGWGAGHAYDRMYDNSFGGPKKKTEADDVKTAPPPPTNPTTTECSVVLETITESPNSTTLNVPIATESASPSGYRLAMRKDGTYVLQGAFVAFSIERKDSSLTTVEWRDIPTVQLPD